MPQSIGQLFVLRVRTLSSVALPLIPTMDVDCHSEVLRQLSHLLLLRYTAAHKAREETRFCDNTACKFLGPSQLRGRLRADLETSLMNGISSLLDEVLGGESM